MGTVIDFQLAKGQPGKAAPAESAPAANAFDSPVMLRVDFHDAEGKPVRLSFPSDEDLPSISTSTMRSIADEFLALSMAMRQKAFSVDGEADELPRLVVLGYGAGRYEVFPLNCSGIGGKLTHTDYEYLRRILSKADKTMLEDLWSGTPK